MMFRYLVPFLLVLAFSLYASLVHATLDAVFANTGFTAQPNRVCLGDGTGRFTCSDVSANTFINTFNSQGVALGNVNGDSFLDAVFADSGSEFVLGINQICLGDGTGRFTCSGGSEKDANESGGVALGDVNSDTFLDAVFANSPSEFSSGINQICLGDGTGQFTCSDVSADNNLSRGVALGDVNGDTFLDAIFANGDNRNRVCLGDGTGQFTCSDVSADTNASLGVALGEVDNTAVTLPTAIPTLSLWGWFLLSILLAGIAMIGRYLKVNMKDTQQ